MPFLPLFNAAQVMHSHVRYLDFKTGQGLRYLTMFSQGIVPINNNELIYTYQGLTSDFNAYLANTAASLNTQPAESFTPNLTMLDAMMSSIEIR